MTQNGYTRKEARALISQGRVTVNGEIAISGSAILDLDRQLTAVDGQMISAEQHIYIMLNKPAGCLTATEDARDKTVLDIINKRHKRPRLAPAGRLDRDVTGLVLLTTDGQLAHRLISPKWKQEKRYIAEVMGQLTREDIACFERGVELGGFTALPAELSIIDASAVSQCRVTLREGKYHQVKRMFEAIGHPVISLRRESISSLTLDESLKPGEYRLLTEGETAALYESVKLKINGE
jgi:16S rRNA pseudouridine516 synthase